MFRGRHRSPGSVPCFIETAGHKDVPFSGVGISLQGGQSWRRDQDCHHEPGVRVDNVAKV